MRIFLKQEYAYFYDTENVTGGSNIDEDIFKKIPVLESEKIIMETKKMLETLLKFHNDRINSKLCL